MTLEKILGDLRTAEEMHKEINRNPKVGNRTGEHCLQNLAFLRGVLAFPELSFALGSSIMRKNFCLGLFGAKSYYVNMLMDNLMLLYKN